MQFKTSRLPYMDATIAGVLCTRPIYLVPFRLLYQLPVASTLAPPSTARLNSSKSLFAASSKRKELSFVSSSDSSAVSTIPDFEAEYPQQKSSSLQSRSFWHPGRLSISLKKRWSGQSTPFATKCRACEASQHASGRYCLCYSRLMLLRDGTDLRSSSSAAAAAAL
eukprot:c31721_g1_i1 orf=1-495(-)